MRSPWWLLLCVFATLPAQAATTEEILSRLDRSAPTFRSMTAELKRVTHTAVINDNTTETGKISMLRGKPGEVRMLIEFAEPDRKLVAFEGRKANIYYPKMNTVEIYDLGKQGKLVDQFLLLGFGSSGKDLAQSYNVKAAGEDKVGGEKTTRLELTPKDSKVLEHLKKVELWIGENGDYPVQQKFFQPSGDYILISYSSVAVNPSLTPDSVRLKLPGNVEKKYPQK